MDEELADIDRRISKLSSQAETIEKKSRVSAFCQIGGAVLLLGTIYLLLPLGTDVHWTFYHLCFWLGLPLFLYGWVWQRKNEFVARRKIELFELARLLKVAEMDKQLAVTIELNVSGRLLFHVHDKKDGPEQRLWVKELGVTQWGEFSCWSDQPGIKWHSKHPSENDISRQGKQKESLDLDRTSEEREYRLHTLQISRAELDAGYEIHPQHLIPVGEEIEGWRFVSMCPFEKKSDQEQITILALLERPLDLR